MALFDLFGFKVKDKTGGKQIPSVISPSSTDGSIIVDSAVVSGGWQGYAYDLDSAVKTENDQIRRYREVAQMPEVDSAVADIVNEAVVSDQDDYPVKLELDNLKVSDPIKKKFQDSFIEILNILEFNERGHDIFRQWYVDGKLYFHILFKDNDIKNGIAEVRQIDPMKIRKVKNINKIKNDKGIDIVDTIEEYYVYNDRGIVENSVQGIKLSPDSVVMVTSGMMDVANMSTIGYLQKTIKPANQLRMLEDAIVIYTITRAPDRRIFYIDVGSLPKMKAEQYVTDIMNKFKNKLVYNASTGELADSKKHLSMIEDFWLARRDGCFSLGTKVKLLDGRDVSIADLSTEYQAGKENWTYSVSPEGKVVPGLITWAGITKCNTQVVDVTLDNGEVITCTPEHKFVLRTGEKIEAQDMTAGMSLMPINVEKRPLYKNKDYFYVQDNETNKWVTVHKMVASYFDEVEPKKVIHHKNLNRFNNNPSNLQIMGKQEHLDLHTTLAKEVRASKTAEELAEWNKNNSEAQLRFYQSEVGQLVKEKTKVRNITDSRIKDGLKKGREAIRANRAKDKGILSHEEYLKKWSPGFTEGISDVGNGVCRQMREHDQANLSEVEFAKKWAKGAATNAKRYAENAQIFDLKKVVELMRDKIHPLFKNNEVLDCFKAVQSDMTVRKMRKLLNTFGYSTVSDFVVRNCDAELSPRRKYNTKHTNNHKVVSIVWREDKIDVGTLTVDGENLYHDYHNYALASGVFVMNSKGTEISSLPGSQSLIQADFVEYFQNKLFQSLNVPISRMKPETGFTLGKSQEITREELKFSKFVGKLRIKFSGLFHSMLRIQLIAKGIIRADEWDNIRSKIRYDFIRDNHFSELKEAEILTNRLATLQLVDPYLGKYYSKRYIQKNVLNMADEDISDIESEIKQEGEDALPSEITNQRAMMQIQQDMAGQQPEQKEQQ